MSTVFLMALNMLRGYGCLHDDDQDGVDDFVMAGCYGDTNSRHRRYLQENLQRDLEV